MNLSTAPVKAAVKPGEAVHTRLRNPWLTIARVAWAALVTLALGLFVAGIPLFYFGEPFELVASRHASLLGLSTGFWLGFYLTRYIVTGLLFSSVAVLIFWHKSDDWMAMLISVLLVTYATWIYRATDMLASDPLWGYAVTLLDVAFGVLLLIFLYLFPNGQFVPRWTGVLAVVWGAWYVLEELFPTSSLAFGYTWPGTLSLLFTVGWVCTGIFSQVYRYARVSSPVERQQTKWVVLGLTAAFLGSVITEVSSLLVSPGYAGVLNSVIGSTMTHVLRLLLPLSIGIAILRYRLWDIDVVINRTLIYGTLTTLLAAAFAASAALIGQVSEIGFGEESKTLAVVVSAILVVTVFEPLRKAVDKGINKRFFPENVEIAREFVEFEPDVRSALSTTELLQTVVHRMCDLMSSRYGAILLDDGQGLFRAVEACNLEASSVPPQPLPEKMHNRWGHARTVRQGEEDLFAVLAPLHVPRVKRDQVIGILGLGPRERERGFSQDDASGLTAFGEKAGCAIYACQLHARSHEPPGVQ